MNSSDSEKYQASRTTQEGMGRMIPTACLEAEKSRRKLRSNYHFHFSKGHMGLELGVRTENKLRKRTTR